MRILDCGRKKRAFQAVAFDATGQLLAAGGDYGATIVWDVATGDRPVQFDALGYGLRGVQFHPRTRHLFIPTSTGLQIHDATTGANVHKLGNNGYVLSLAFDPTGDWFVYCHQPDSRGWVLSALHWLDETSQTPLWSVGVGDATNESGYVYHLGCLGDGKRFMSAEYVTNTDYRNNRYRVALRSRADGRVLQASDKVFSYGDRVFASPLLDSIVVMDGVWLRVYAVNNLATAPRVLKNDNRKHFTGVAVHPSGKYLAATSNDETVKLFDTTTWEVARTFTWDIGRMRSIAFSPDGALAAAGSESGKIVVWDVDV
jgi:hypothetical protein